MRRTIWALAVSALLVSAAAAQTEPLTSEPTQQIAPTSPFTPSPTNSIDAADDPFAGGPVDLPFSAIGADELARIVLFDQPNLRGRRIGITEDTPDLSQSGFASIASAVRVHGGVWELCAEKEYRGQCRRVSATTNLDTTGFGDKAQSVRLVR